MDPTTIAPVHSDATVALLFGLCMALIKLIERGGPWLVSLLTGDRDGHTAAADGPQVVQLDPVASQAIAEVLAHTRVIEDVVDRRDGDGVPLVYAGSRLAEVRSELESVRQQAEGQHVSVMRALDRRG